VFRTRQFPTIADFFARFLSVGVEALRAACLPLGQPVPMKRNGIKTV
jgi:hypothetical protein